jgi:hypothetical protein
MQRRTRRIDRRHLVPLMIGALALLVLRSPTDVVTVFAPRATDVTAPVEISSEGSTVASVRARDAGGVAFPEEVDAVVRGSRDLTQDAPAGRFGTPASRPTSALLLEELRGGWRLESGVEEAAALAVVAAHTWAVTSGAAHASSGPSGGAIVTVEAIDRPGAHHAVVTLLVAAPAAATYDLHRIAVPVLLDADGPTIAGAPWALPAPTMRTSSVAGGAIGDVELIAAARRALEDVGIPGERLVALEVTDGWPFIARLEDDAGGHPWLRWHVDRFVVAGLPLDAARK